MESVCLVDGFQTYCYPKNLMTYYQVPMTCHVNHYSSPKALEDHPFMPLLKTCMLYSALTFAQQIPRYDYSS